MSQFITKVIITCSLASAIVSCGKDAEIEKAEQQPMTAIASEGSETAPTDASQWTVSADVDVPADKIGDDKSLAAVLGSADIPYPLYPNSSKYRVGGENGLKVVLFQTEDTFEQVDAFFQSQAKLPRLSAMNDYVRYSTDSNDQDPWATAKPGIVIHQFNDADERQAVGADETAKTNIIMSFQ